MTTTIFKAKTVRFLPKFLLIFVLLFSWGGVLFASDWVLAASPFSFTQTGPKSPFQEKTRELLPKMILEQIGTGDMRLPPRSEMLDRKIDSLRKDRQSLFLQLSAAIKERDKIFLQESNQKKLQKKIAEQEKKIKEIQDKIDANIENVDKAVRQIEEESLENAEEKSNLWQSIASLFSAKEEKLVPDSVNEPIKIYHEDSETLLSPGEEIWSTGMESRDFVNFMSGEGVNGYLTGSLTFYGNYFSVAVELRIYPDGKKAGSIIEVGNVDNMVSVARNITQYLRTVVINSAPVQLYFDISPEDAAKNALVKIDGTVSNLSGNSLSVTAGLHTISVDSPGFESLAVTYNFKNSTSFFVRIPMYVKRTGQFNIYLNPPTDSTLFADGYNVGNGIYGGTITINGSPVIGQIRRTVPVPPTVDEEGNEIASPDKIFTSFYYIPMDLQTDGASLTVKTKPVDSATLIDTRRKWAYRGYSAFVLTLPLTFIAEGNYRTAVNGYNAGYGDRATAEAWGYIRTGAIVLTVSAAGFFIYELVRYLHAASSVLPDSAKPSTQKDLELVQSVVQIYDEEPSDGGNENADGNERKMEEK